jgi:hypothetical protein
MEPSMGLADLIDSTRSVDMITPHYLEWLNGPRLYSEQAIRFAEEQLHNKRMQGPKAYRASDAGTCIRRRQLTRYGPEQPPPKPSLANIFDTGSMMHLKWQMAGITDGWITQGEVPFYYPDMDSPLVRGKADGRTSWGSLFEFKSTNDHTFKRVKEQQGPLREHKLQAGYAMLATGLQSMNIVYEEKSSGEWVEFFIPGDEHLIGIIEQDAEVLAQYDEAREVAPIKPLCLTKEGREYSRCPWKDSCPMAEVLVEWT